jgi:F420-dependent oxidoreductase-like protein
MRVGLHISPNLWGGVPDEDLFDRLIEISQTAESSAFDSLWVGDHFYAQETSNETHPRLEAYAVLCGFAARTQRVKLGTMVTGATYRNPAHLAKIVTALDVMSKGRAILGIGAGWNEAEHRGFGYPFPPVGVRMDILSETVQICRAMFDSERATFSGSHHSIVDALNYPRPLQEHIPILVGGGGEKRTLRIVAEYADACNISGSLATIQRKLAVLEQHAASVGRDLDLITKTALKMIIVNEKPHEVARIAAAARVEWKLDEAAFADFAFFGNQQQVVEQIGRYLSSGIDGLICIIPGQFDQELVASAGESVREAVGSG